MYIGIDLGTSGVKAILMDDEQKILASHTQNISISRPHPLWSEQDPNEWWSATDIAMQSLKEKHDLSDVKAIGLSGQMHGATLIDKQGEFLRPAILWNDGRCEKQCIELEKMVPNSRAITGNLMMPGFTAPKLKWVQENEPHIFNKINKVLLPKDYLRYRMTGEYASDMSDSAGTMWLDVKQRKWNESLLTACDLTPEKMPKLFEGNQITGYLVKSIANNWGMSSVPVIAGGGDNAAGAIGVGLHEEGQAMLSLGTSGVYFIVTEKFLSKPEDAVHSFCHALPNRWHLMSVMLSAASSLNWACKILKIKDAPSLFNLVENTHTNKTPVYFLPYLSGERTPHNNPNLTGVFWGVTHQHDDVDMANAVINGISFALADCMDVLHSTGVTPKNIILIGGGARNAFWRQRLSDISGHSLEYRQGGDVGPALGAAKLAQLAHNPNTEIAKILKPLPLEQCHEPNKTAHIAYQEQREVFRKLYQQLKPSWS